MISLILFVALFAWGELGNRKADTFYPSIVHSFAALAGFFGIVFSLLAIYLDLITHGRFSFCFA